MRSLILLLSVMLLGLKEVGAQMKINPDISLIGDFRGTYHSDKEGGPNEASKVLINFQGLEVAANGYLNPYARADVFLGFHNEVGSFEIEEAYITLLRGLPLSSQLKLGQYLVDLGRTNLQHPHQWSWIEKPLVHSEMLGEEGYRTAGINLSSLYPVRSMALGFSLNLLRQGPGGHSHDHPSSEDSNESPPEIAISGRLVASLPLSPTVYGELGGSLIRFKPEYEQSRIAHIGGVDLKMKWKPDDYRSLTAIGEAIFNRHPTEEDSSPSQETEVSSWGMFASLDFQFRKRFNVGAIYDWTQGLEDREEVKWRWGLFGGFSLLEETTRYQLVVRQEHHPKLKPFFTAIVQVLWSLGPHKPHTF